MYANKFSILGFEVWKKCFMDAFTILFSTVKYIFVLYLENPQKAGDP